MDPLSVTASIIAVLQLSSKVLGYLSDVKEASKDRAKCAVEAANAHSLLMNLRFRLEDGSADAPWYTAVRALGVENGPLDQFKHALEELQSGMIDKGPLQRAGKALVWKFRKEEVISILARIERLKTLVGIALDMDHFKLSQAIKNDTNSLRTDISATKSQVDRICQDQDDEKYKKVTEWVSSTNYSAQQADIIARRQERTGQWFLDAPEVTRWIDEPKGTLFCPGVPGAGKTIVAAIAIDFLSNSVQSSSVGVAYVYCNYKEQEQQNASSILAAILKQLVQSRPSAIEPVTRLHKQHERGTKPSLDEICATLREVIAEYSTVYIVIDALDECQDRDGSRHQLLTRLQDLQAELDIRLMATSQFIPEIEEKFKQSEKLEIRASDEDVRRFVAGQMHRLPKCIQRDPALQQLVEETIPERTDGMFLLARLHVDSLLDKTTAKKVKTTLANLSKGSAALDNAYKDALQRIESQLEGQYELAKKTLSWITYAKRPLTTAELCCALAVEPEETELDPDNLPDPEDLLSVCAGLVIVDQETAVVRLVHYTTQEYFERVMDTWNPVALLEITSTCLTYLSFDTFQTGMSLSDQEYEKRLQENEFLAYASKHWGEHAWVVQDELCVPICTFLRNSKLVSCTSQVLLASKYHFPNYSQLCRRFGTGLHLATRFDLSSVIEKALVNEERDGKAALEQRDSYGRTALCIAAERGLYSTTKVLLEQGAHVNDRSLNVLNAASANGHKAIVKLLLEKGAKTNAMTLWRAADKGHESTVKLLLENGADVNAINGRHGSALGIASRHGFDTIVKLLLEKGAEVNVKDWKHGTALQAAATRGRESIVKLLLENGADTNTKYEHHNSALQAASAIGNETIVRLLLEAGADVNTCKGGGARSALQIASARGNETIVKLLLENGAEVNVENIYLSPLEVALEKGHDGVAKILRDAGAC